MAKKKKKRKKKPYFGKAVDAAIIQYNESDSLAEKNKLYTEMIYPALDKLAENIINNGKFRRWETTFSDFKSDVVTYMTERLDKFKPGKGKAYSYYNRVGRNFCIKVSQDLYAKAKNKKELDVIDWERDIPNEKAREDYKETLSDFLLIWCSWLENNMDDIFNSQRDKMITEALIELFRNAEDLDIYNKKLINVLIKEYGVGINTQNITKVQRKLKGMFYDQFEHFRKTGRILSEPYI